MVEDYVVDVAAPASGETAAVTGNLARILKLDRDKVATLIRRLPDVVTRPISFDEATLVVERFSRAGLRARVRRVSRDSSPTLFDFPDSKPTFESDSGSAAPLAGNDDDLFLETDDMAEPVEASRIFRAEDLEEGPTEFETHEHDVERFDTQFPPLVDTPPDPVVTDEVAASPRDSRTFETFEEVTPAELQARLRGDRPAAAADSAAAAVAAQAEQETAARAETAGAAEATTAPMQDPASAAAAAAAGRRTGGRRGSLQSKLLTTAIIPVLLTIIGALAATWYTARPALYQQLLDSARNPAIATAASLSSAFEQTASTGGIDYLQLQNTILITRQAFPREDIAFIIATDTLGNPLPGFFAGSISLTADAAELQNAIRDRALEAIDLGTDARTGRTGSSSQLAAAGSGIEIVAQPLIVNQEPVGAVVVGVSDAAVTAQVNRIIVNVLLFSLIPLLLAILIAVRRARRLTDNVLKLTNRADEISRGELEEQVEFHSGDELDDLAAALERMRVSMRGALDRLRRRR